MKLLCIQQDRRRDGEILTDEDVEAKVQAVLDALSGFESRFNQRLDEFESRLSEFESRFNQRRDEFESRFNQRLNEFESRNVRRSKQRGFPVVIRTVEHTTRPGPYGPVVSGYRG